MPTQARAFWIREPGRGEIRTVALPEPGPGEVLVRTLRSGVSRGTEGLVFRGGVPQSQYDVMRAPFQEGDFPGPVKYGYLNVGVVDRGPDDPGAHRLLFLPVTRRRTSCRPTPWVVPRRGPAGACRPRRHGGDRGQRPMGRRAAGRRPDHGRRRRHGRVLRRPAGRWRAGNAGDAGRRGRHACAHRGLLGVDFALPEDALRVGPGNPRQRDVSRAAASLALLAADGTVDLSWYGDQPVRCLPGGFHSGRLGIRASRVGDVAVARRGRYHG